MQGEWKSGNEYHGEGLFKLGDYLQMRRGGRRNEGDQYSGRGRSFLRGVWQIFTRLSKYNLQLPSPITTGIYCFPIESSQSRLNHQLLQISLNQIINEYHRPISRKLPSPNPRPAHPNFPTTVTPPSGHQNPPPSNFHKIFPINHHHRSKELHIAYACLRRPRESRLLFHKPRVGFESSFIKESKRIGPIIQFSQFLRSIIFLSQASRRVMSHIQLSQPNTNAPHPSKFMTVHSASEELGFCEEPSRMQELVEVIVDHMRKAEGAAFQASLHYLMRLFQKGCTSRVSEQLDLIKKIMSLFAGLAKINARQFKSDVQYRMFFVLSLMAELVRQETNLMLPFNRESAQAVLEIDCESITNEEERAKLLAILSVLISNLSRQTKLIAHLKIEKLLKQALLQNYPLITEVYTVKQFNQSIMRLQTKKVVSFTLCELERYHIKDIILKTIPKEQIESVIKCIEQIFPRNLAESKIHKN